MFISNNIVYHFGCKNFIYYIVCGKKRTNYRGSHFLTTRRSLNKNQNISSENISLLLQSGDQSFPFLFRKINLCINNLLFCFSAVFSRSSNPSRYMILGINFNVLISPLNCNADLADVDYSQTDPVIC